MSLQYPDIDSQGKNRTRAEPRVDTTAVLDAGREKTFHRADLNVVLVNPQIPQNTGNVARTCAATSVSLHLVGPLGFLIDDKQLKRAGLDYWPYVCVKIHDNWEAFELYWRELQGAKRIIAFSKFGRKPHCAPAFEFKAGDWLLFGAETTGLPEEAHELAKSHGEIVRIPMVERHVRSINLSVSAGVGLFEAIRQLDEKAGRITDFYQLPDGHDS